MRFVILGARMGQYERTNFTDAVGGLLNGKLDLADGTIEAENVWQCWIGGKANFSTSTQILESGQRLAADYSANETLSDDLNGL